MQVWRLVLHDTIANLAGFSLLKRGSHSEWEIGGNQWGAGDVIDVRLFQFSIVEVGNWVDADQSTGRIIHVPNSHVLKYATANSHVGLSIFGMKFRC